MKVNLIGKCVKCDREVFFSAEEIEAAKKKRVRDRHFHGIEMVCSNCVRGDKTERNKDIKKLREWGLTYREIAVRLGVTKGVVSNVIAKK